jgi:hypothetical protein
MTKFEDMPGTHESDIDWIRIEKRSTLNAVSLMKELREKTQVPVTFLHWGVKTDIPRGIVGLTNTCTMDMILFIAFCLRIDSRQYGTKLFHKIRKLLDPAYPDKLDAKTARNILASISRKQEYYTKIQQMNAGQTPTAINIWQKPFEYVNYLFARDILIACTCITTSVRAARRNNRLWLCISKLASTWTMEGR